MTDEYIKKEDVLREKRTGTFPNGICMEAKACVTVEYIKSIPPADVAQIRHSRWIKTEDGAECEKCGREAVYQIVDDHWEYEPWCPHCGAIMDNKRGNEND